MMFLQEKLHIDSEFYDFSRKSVFEALSVLRSRLQDKKSLPNE